MCRRASACCLTATHVPKLGMVGVGVAVLLAVTIPAAAQPSFSIDGQSPTSFGSGLAIAFSEGDVLGPGPVPLAIAPGLFILPTFTGPLPPTYAELDGLSYGADAVSPFTPFGLGVVDLLDGHGLVHRWNFSVDEFAGGDPASPVPPGGPSVFTEGAFGMGEASADVFVTALPAAFGPGAGPIPAPPFRPFPGSNVQVFDGDGTTAPGLGLIEPNPPTPFVFGVSATPDGGDNLDALDVDTVTPVPLAPGTPVFFTMDSGFADPIENPFGLFTPAGFAGPNFGTAAANGFSGSDIVVSPAGAFVPITLYAGAPAMGLDTMGFDTDDVDALIVADMGPTPGVYDAVTGPYSWIGGGTDMVLFSLRRGSATIGMLDSLTGTPIEEGDILIPGFAGTLPGIFVAAEDLGLGTIRAGSATFVDTFGALWADDLDALDVEQHKHGDVDGDFDVDAEDIDAMAALASGPVPFGAPLVADMNFDFVVGNAFNAGGGLVSDTDILIRVILGTEYGDANLDGRIDILDLDLLGQGFGLVGMGWTFGDFNGSGMTDVADFAILASRYGFVAPGAGAGTVSPLIPEPTAGFLVGVGLLLACFGFRGARLRSGWTWPVVRLFAVPLVTLTLAPNAFAVQVVDDPLGRASTSISVQRSPVAGFLTYTVSVSPLSPMKEITSIDAAFTAPSMRQVSLFGPTVFTNLNFLFPLVGENPLSDSQFEYDNSPPVLSVFASESATSLAAAFTNFAPILSSQPIAHVVMPDGVVGTMNMTLVLRDIGVPGVGQTAIFSSVKFTAVPGDYNNDGLVDAADYVVWRKYVGTTTAIPNDPHGGTIGINQFNTWRSNFGTSLPGSGSGVSLVPEPGSFLLVLLAAGLTVCLCRLRIRAIRVPEVPGWRHSIAHQLL